MQFAYRIDLWDADGNSVVKHLADIDDLIVAGGHFRCGMQAVAGGVHHVASGQPYHPRQPPEWGCITQGRQAFNAEDAYLEHTGA